MANYNVSKSEAKEQGIERVLVGGGSEGSSSGGGSGQLGAYESEKESLSEKYHPDMLPQFNDVLMNISKRGYEARQETDAKNLKERGFDPSQVSGNVFSSILGGLEKRRGGDITKVFDTSMGATVKSQEMIQDRMNQLDGLMQEEKSRIQQYDQWKAEMDWQKEQFSQEMAYKRSSRSGGGGGTAGERASASQRDALDGFDADVEAFGWAGPNGNIDPAHADAGRTEWVKRFGTDDVDVYDEYVANKWLEREDNQDYDDYMGRHTTKSVSERNADAKKDQGARDVEAFAENIISYGPVKQSRWGDKQKTVKYSDLDLDDFDPQQRQAIIKDLESKGITVER